MTSGDTRRTFLSALLLAGGSAAAFAKSFQQEPGGTAASGDALFEHVQLQMIALLRNSRARGGFLAAEDAATAAAFMRVAAIHARGLQLDDAARHELDARLSAVGRAGLITVAPEASAIRARLRRKGLAMSDRLASQVAGSDEATRQAAIQAIRSGHLTLICDRLSDALESAAPQLASTQRDARRTALAPDESWCNFLVGQWTMFLSIAWYVASFNDSTLQEFLDAMWSGFVFYDTLYTQQC